MEQKVDWVTFKMFWSYFWQLLFAKEIKHIIQFEGLFSIFAENSIILKPLIRRPGRNFERKVDWVTFNMFWSSSWQWSSFVVFKGGIHHIIYAFIFFLFYWKLHDFKTTYTQARKELWTESWLGHIQRVLVFFLAMKQLCCLQMR